MSRLYIDGAWFDAASGETRSIINPFDGSEIARVAEGDQADARAAIISARRAFDNGPWSQTTGAERADLLVALADAIAANREELARLETTDTGKTTEESRWDMDDVSAVFNYYAGLALEEAPEVLEALTPMARASPSVSPSASAG